MEIFNIALLLTTFLCSLVAGFLFAFAVVVMPGIRSLSDSAFIRAFQVMDRIIQNNQPIFIFVWIGSIVAMIVSVALATEQLQGIDFVLVLAAAATYIIGVQLPTIIINVPLNNKLQTVDSEAISETEQKLARKNFESRWNRWNSLRTVLAGLTSVMLLILLYRL